MKTTVEINGTVYEVVPQHYGAENWVASCNLCDCGLKLETGTTFCGVASIFDCQAYDTHKFSVHLKRLATPSIGLNTPSEARRGAVV